MTKKHLKILLIISSVLTAIGLALATYNHFVFGKPFLNRSTIIYLISLVLVTVNFILLKNKDK